MSRRIVFIAGLLAVLWAAAVPAGEIKTHCWPCELVPLEIASIPVLMDVGYWIEITNQDAFIKLQQKTINTYEGCTNLKVRCNAALTLSSTIRSTGAVPGTYSTFITKGANLDMPGGTVTVCAKLKDPNLTKQPGGLTNVQVATVTLWVVPRAL
ncbi:MAG TPA: hypothetical protein PKH24_07240 [Sedimentisphaerales bacterium]|jgi:hypothetical protein|nr:hypothetical protein [Sedimentisphaerales bacterium]HNU30135.1 hypothetical protein [Sedimentisphaerales bacterium]